MTRDLGVWTAPDCALVLIDCQEEMFEVLPSIPSELDGIEPIDRSSMNALEDQAFRQAVEATGRMRLIVGGLHTEICLTFAAVQALKDGPTCCTSPMLPVGARRPHTAQASNGSPRHDREVVPRRTIHYPVPAHTPGP